MPANKDNIVVFDRVVNSIYLSIYYSIYLSPGQSTQMSQSNPKENILRWQVTIDFVLLTPDWLRKEHVLCQSITIKGAVSRQSSSFCLILPFTRPQSLWNLK